MENKNIAFVILHFNVIEETIKCIESIQKKIDTSRYIIIIVDNGSKNNSGRQLFDTYSKVENIEVVINDENLGFSKGNNIGCKIAIEKYQAEYLCIINNDTELISDNIYFETNECYKKTQFDACGPYIWYTLGNFNQNPFLVPDNLCDVTKEYKKWKVRNFFAQKNLYIIFSVLDKIMLKITKKPNANGVPGLNGAAVIFSRKYYKRYGTEVFMEQSFLYFEESFLQFRKNKDDLIFVYNNDIKLLHNESLSTRSGFSNNNKRWKFLMKNYYAAVSNLKKLYEEYEI